MKYNLTDIKDYRRYRLAEEVIARGGIEKMCAYYNINKANYISQILNKHVTFGEKAAEGLRIEMGKPFGWFEHGFSPEKIAFVIKEEAAEYTVKNNINPRVQKLIDRIKKAEQTGEINQQLLVTLENMLDLASTNKEN
jgi:hypothetical protein